jgi:hypothetical protein
VAAACHVDADCGSGGYCSPSPDPCTLRGSPGPDFAGIIGYYCHKPARQCTKDECTNAADCDGGAICQWSPSAATWDCRFGMCE